MSDCRMPWIKCHPSFQVECVNASAWPGPSLWIPLIMLYDEPTTGLDPVTSDEISSLINDVQKKYKTSSIIITHDIECARYTADRIIMLHDGEVYQEGNWRV